MPIDTGRHVIVDNPGDFPGGGAPLPVEIENDVGNPIPVSGPLTDAQLRAAAVPISGNVGVIGAVEIVNDAGNPIPVSGPLTDAQLRAAAVPVSHGGLTDAQLRAAAVPVSGPLTDAQLRAAAVPVSGPLTDAQLRAAAVPIVRLVRAQTIRASAIVIAPAANGVIADSGQLAAGDYEVQIEMGSTGVAALGKGMSVEHRNAANGANIHTFTVPTPVAFLLAWLRVTVALNERIRVVNATTVGEALSRYSAHIAVRPAV